MCLVYIYIVWYCIVVKLEIMDWLGIFLLLLWVIILFIVGYYIMFGKIWDRLYEIKIWLVWVVLKDFSLLFWMVFFMVFRLVSFLICYGVLFG